MFESLDAMAPSRVWIAFRWCPSFQSSLACSMVADRSFKRAACSIEWYAWPVKLPFLERWALVSQAADMSELPKPPLK
jgi:hypothetical protein